MRGLMIFEMIAIFIFFILGLPDVNLEDDEETQQR